MGSINFVKSITAAVFISSVFVGLSGSAVLAAAAKNVKCNGCVHTKDIANKAVTSKKIANGAVTPKRLAPNAQPVGVAASEIDTAVVLVSGADTTLRSVTIPAPGPGAIVANGSMFADYFGSGNGRVACLVTTGTSIEDGPYTLAAGDPISFDSINQTRTFPVIEAGDVTIRFVCRGISGDVEYNNPALTAFFVPMVYGIVSE